MLAATLLWVVVSQGNDIDVELSQKALQGAAPPSLTLKLNQAISSLEIALEAATPVKVKRGPLASGQEIKVLLPAPLGKTHYSGKLTAKFASGRSASMPLEFDVEVFAPLGLNVDLASVDTQAGTLMLTLSRAADRCDYRVVRENEPPASGVATFNGEPAGTPLQVSFGRNVSNGLVLQISLTCHDRDGFFQGRDLFPWRLDIPHEDVIFASGQAEIVPSEEQKLTLAAAEIQKAVRRYGSIVKIRLFVVGHTDTVGATAANQELSQARAKAIASYFRNAGVRIPIRYMGRGEGRLAVNTADEVDEPQNRRAEYVLAVEDPDPGAWRDL